MAKPFINSIFKSRRTEPLLDVNVNLDRSKKTSHCIMHDHFKQPPKIRYLTVISLRYLQEIHHNKITIHAISAILSRTYGLRPNSIPLLTLYPGSSQCRWVKPYLTHVPRRQYMDRCKQCLWALSIDQTPNYRPDKMP
ncbi:hypothetical protein LENED_004570 [Lentinula edodes]|uniref:Uncharacterized protein n=1 Tax=Lentinula edodes TaxID=5353 RepID=A0A1Q3E6N1_LENED|nr:hypothetical protein LENED_004570 [Lentinula edodes]